MNTVSIYPAKFTSKKNVSMTTDYGDVQDVNYFVSQLQSSNISSTKALFNLLQEHSIPYTIDENILWFSDKATYEKAKAALLSAL